MKVSVEYIRPKSDSEEKESSIETTYNLITYAFGKQYPDGIDGNGPVRRMFGRIQRKMDIAMEDDENSLDFEQGEVDLITKSISECKFPHNWARLVYQLEDALNGKTDSVPSNEPEAE